MAFHAYTKSSFTVRCVRRRQRAATAGVPTTTSGVSHRRQPCEIHYWPGALRRRLMPVKRREPMP